MKRRPGKNPMGINEMNLFAKSSARLMLLLVLTAGTGAHALHVPGAQHRPDAGAVLMLERSVDHVGDDLHVLVTVGLEAAAGLHGVVVDDP